jgi:hypothetical protein
MTKLEKELLDFISTHEDVVRNALEIHVREMTKVAEETLAAYESAKDAPKVKRPLPSEGSMTISLMPTPGGFQQMSRMFTESAKKAQAALDALEALAEKVDEL